MQPDKRLPDSFLPSAGSETACVYPLALGAAGTLLRVSR